MADDQMSGMTTPPDSPSLFDLEAALRNLNPVVRGLAEPFFAAVLVAVADLQAQVAALKGEVEAERVLRVDLEAQSVVKQHRIDQLERQLFGRKSERIRVTDPKRAARQATRKKRTAEQREAERQGEREKHRKALDALATVTTVIPLPADACCPHCGGGDLRLLGEGEKSVQYEWRPGHLERVVYVREKGACPCGHGIVTAPPPPQVIEGGQYGPGLHAHVVVAKCVDALPLHRQARAFERLGVPLSVSQLCALFHRSADRVAPIYEFMVRRLPESWYVQADETTQPVLAPGQVRKGWMWTFLDPQSIVFVYDPSRGGKTPAKVLGRSPGALTVDGYTGYNQVTTPDGRQRVGCWSHARRELYEAHAYAPEMVDELLLAIHDLFVVEQEAIEEGMVGSRPHLRLRQRRSKPRMERIFAILDARVGEFSPGSTMAKAMRYVLNQRNELSVFLTDARVPLHNNASESALRIVALLRKNALFVGHDEGGRSLAILLTMCATCRLHGVDPQRWFADALLRVSERGSTIEELLPWVWKRGRGQESDAVP